MTKTKMSLRTLASIAIYGLGLTVSTTIGRASEETFGFSDPGFRKATVRGELGSRNTIDIGDCLYKGACPDGITCSPCPIGPAEYKSANTFSTVTPAPKDDFWLLEYNNDTGALALSFDNKCNSGPPNQSNHVGIPSESSGVFAFWTDNSGESKRSHLSVDNKYNLCPNSIPYMGIGSHKNQGNKGDSIAWFNISKSRISEDSHIHFQSGIDVMLARVALLILC